MIKLRYLLLFSLIGCSTTSNVSKKPAPSWLSQPTRTVENGYVIYVSKGSDPTLEKALFKAESVAIQDVANECSFAPKGTRIEDTFEEAHDGVYDLYVKMGVSFEDCDSAKQALDPEAIRKLANVTLTEELTRYQDLYETDPSKNTLASNQPNSDSAGSSISSSSGDSSLHSYSPTGSSASPSADTSAYSPANSPAPGASERGIAQPDAMEYFMLRQELAYQKQVVILAPSIAYAPNSSQSQTFTQSITGTSQTIQNLEHQSPGLRSSNQAWSNLPGRPVMRRPEQLKAYAQGLRLSSPHSNHSGAFPRGPMSTGSGNHLFSPGSHLYGPGNHSYGGYGGLGGGSPRSPGSRMGGFRRRGHF